MRGISRWSHIWTHGALLAAAFMAGKFNLRMQANLHVMLERMGFCFTVETFLAEMGYNRSQAERDAGTALRDRLQAAADRYEAARLERQAAREEAKSKQAAVIAEHKTKKLHREQAKIDMIRSDLSDQQSLKDAYTMNLTTDLDEQSRHQKQLRQWNDGVCNTSLTEPACQVIGGAAALQKQLRDERVRIHQEWHALLALRQGVFLEETVLQSLEAQAARYNRTATEQYEHAVEWHEQSKSDLQHSMQLAEAAADLQQESVILERGQRLYDSVDALTYAAEYDYVTAYRYAAVAVALATLALAYFVMSCAVRTNSLVRSTVAWSYHGGTLASRLEFIHCVSYCVQHCVIFLLVVGWMGAHLLILNEYPSIKQRAVVLLWFSAFAALIQTFLLHALAQVFTTIRRSGQDPRRFVIDLSKRWLTLAALFLLEILITWWMFSPAAVARLGSLWGFRVPALLCLGIHVLLMEPPRRHHVLSTETPETEDPTVLMDSDGASVSQSTLLEEEGGEEVTPMLSQQGDSYQSVDPSNVTAPSSQQPQQGTAPSTNDGNGHSDEVESTAVTLTQELYKLLLPLDLLVALTCGAILRYCLPVVWNGHRVSRAVWLVVLVTALLAAGIVVQLLHILRLTAWRRYYTDKKEKVPTVISV